MHERRRGLVEGELKEDELKLVCDRSKDDELVKMAREGGTTALLAQSLADQGARATVTRAAGRLNGPTCGLASTLRRFGMP